MIQRDPQALLIDADDVLWENHALFLEVHRRFHALMAGNGHGPDEVERTLLALERERTRAHGYGSLGFVGSLVETFRLLRGAIDAGTRTELEALGRWIHEHPIVPFDGVASTLGELAGRHRLLLVTKGDPGEQRGKIDRSGLARHFEAIEILREKDAAAYAGIVRRHGTPAGGTWMIGNSPRSDINPARRAGLRTVYIPHRSLWSLEDEPFEAPPDLELARFAELRDHF